MRSAVACAWAVSSIAVRNSIEIPQVINGASDLMHELFGENGTHARTAVGVANLPRGAAVEVDGIFALG